MITKAIVQIIGFIVNIPCKYFLASAFSWNELNLQFVATEHSIRRWKWGSFVMTFYFLFLLYGLAKHIYGFKSESMFATAYHTLQVYVPVLNGFLKYFLHFSDISGKTTNSVVRRQILLVELCLKMLIQNIFTLPVFAMVQYVRNSGSSVHLSSLFLNFPILFKIFYCPIGILQVILLGSMISELTFNTILTVLTPFFYMTTFTTFRYSPCVGDTFCLQTKKRDVPNLIPFMRTAQVIGNIYGKVLQGRILPLHFVLSYLTAISLFSLIMFRHYITWELILILLTTGVTAAAGWSVILWFLGQYFRTGRKFFASWQYAEWSQSKFERKLMKKFYRSFRPIEFITCPKIFCFRPVTMLKYLHFVNWLLAKALIVVE